MRAELPVARSLPNLPPPGNRQASRVAPWPKQLGHRQSWFARPITPTYHWLSAHSCRGATCPPPNSGRERTACCAYGAVELRGSRTAAGGLRALKFNLHTVAVRRIQKPERRSSSASRRVHRSCPPRYWSVSKMHRRIQLGEYKYDSNLVANQVTFASLHPLPASGLDFPLRLPVSLPPCLSCASSLSR
jgi:hypothetical protein